MKIISHRGYWHDRTEKNTETAFERSFRLGFGTETDFRDFLGDLVIAHDPPREKPLDADRCFSLLARHDPNLPLAINIKADGLQHLLKKALAEYGLTNYFLFDMSVPDAVQSLKQGLRCFTRQSDLEPAPSFYKEAAGVWMDGFFTDWITPEAIRPHLKAGKQVCLVSPELHGREHRRLWDLLAGASDLLDHPDLLLCSDLPETARNYLNT